jgi:MHS family proline/betaine transporter-like MFS transporter
MLTAAVLMLLTIYPMFSILVGHPTFGTLLAVETIFGLLMTAYFAPVPAILSELFPTQTRTTGLSLSYNTAVTIFGGFAPFILTWLISATNDKLSPSYYLLFAASISIAALICTRVRLGFR